MSSGFDIKIAIRDLIADLDPAIVPSTSFAASSAPGDTSVLLHPLLDAAGRSRIVAGARLTPDDGSGERSLPITRVEAEAGNTRVHLDFAGLPDAGLVYAHEADQGAYANLLTFHPSLESVGRSVILGDPAICLSVLKKNSSQQETLTGYALYHVRLTYYRQFTRPEPDDSGYQIDAASWQEDQENACLQELERIEAMLLKNQELKTRFAPAAALKFAAVNNSTDLVVTLWDWEPREGDIWDLVATQDIYVSGYGQATH